MEPGSLSSGREHDPAGGPPSRAPALRAGAPVPHPATAPAARPGGGRPPGPAFQRGTIRSTHALAPRTVTTARYRTEAPR